METRKLTAFPSLNERVGKFGAKNKKFLIPDMNRTSSYVLAGAFRGFGIRAEVMETYKGNDLGKEYTSGKECYPCLVTIGDVLYHMKQEQKRLGEEFDVSDYLYFMAESDGPCRFGMYNKYQRIVLDSFPEFRGLRIGTLTSSDSYSMSGTLDENEAKILRRVAFVGLVAADLLDRILWRTRPYEKVPGSTDRFIDQATHEIADILEAHGPKRNFKAIYNAVESVARRSVALKDPSIPRKPRIGIVGEIYLRTHTAGNQDLIRTLETYGAEVVNASIAEWTNYTAYDKLRESWIACRRALKGNRPRKALSLFRETARYSATFGYQMLRQKQLYDRVRKWVDVPVDHAIGRLEQVLKRTGLYTFEIGTEACLSIAGILEYAEHGYNGVVNVYPFTCMPSTATSAVIRPEMNKRRIPYLDMAYDGTFQPGREAAIRTFMYQARQHFERNGGGTLH